ncbi:uncharacterized protein L201_002895 [Kwoniella dendrophila CBS 6074]|uniref:Uncharacterized protein n=1 Tax=Kwoniella dendrophila CBS 6074 TaxID=1295534 RepID=A0AAX4JSW8_9TREE
MTSLLPLPQSTFPSSSSSSPLLSSSHITSSRNLDAKSLANLIRQLKRSPESPSRLTLPPIMGILDTRNQREEMEEGKEGPEDEEEETNVVIQEVNSPFIAQQGLCDIPEDEEVICFPQVKTTREVQVNGLSSPNRDLWVIAEESEEAHDDVNDENPYLSSYGSYASESNSSTHLTEEYTPPIDPYCPPPPSPSMIYIPSPTLPDCPTVPTCSSPENNNPSDLFSEAGPSHFSSIIEASLSPFPEASATEQFEDASVPDQDNQSPATSYDSSFVPQRRRRRTLGEVEPYRKFAMNKAAWLSFQAAEAYEERRRIKEQEEREGIWMRYRGNTVRSRSKERESWFRPDSITRAQSFPPFTKSSTTSFLTADHTHDYSNTSTDRGDRFSSNWYVEAGDEDDLSDEEQVQHVEYASSPQSYLVNIPKDNQNRSKLEEDYEEDEASSPVSEQLETPGPSNTPRIFFPSASEIFGASRYSPYTSSSNSQNRKEDSADMPRTSLPTSNSPQSYGLGLGLTGMNTSEANAKNGNNRMSFDQMIKYHEGNDNLDDNEISLVEIPIRVIFPQRSFQDNKTFGREYSEWDGRNKQEEMMDESRSNYREDLDGIPVPERGRSRSRNPRSMGSSLSYTFYPSMSYPEEGDQSNIPAYYDEASKPYQSTSISPDSIYSDDDVGETINRIRSLEDLSLKSKNQTSIDEESHLDQSNMDHKRRNSAPGKLPSFASCI